MDLPTSPSRTPKLAVERLAGAVAHALRNPLAGALASLEGLEARTAGAAGDAEAVERAIACVRRAAVFVDDLVELASPPAAIPRAVDLKAFARANAPRWTERVAAAGRRLTVDVAADLPRVHVDPCLLGRAVDRLLDRALECTRAGAAVRVAAAMEGERAALSVADRGRGEADELGLALVQSSVALFGASLRVERSAAGETRATLRLPCAQALEVA